MASPELDPSEDPLAVVKETSWEDTQDGHQPVVTRTCKEGTRVMGPCLKNQREEEQSCTACPEEDASIGTRPKGSSRCSECITIVSAYYGHGLL